MNRINLNLEVIGNKILSEIKSNLLIFIIDEMKSVNDLWGELYLKTKISKIS